VADSNANSLSIFERPRGRAHPQALGPRTTCSVTDARPSSSRARLIATRAVQDTTGLTALRTIPATAHDQKRSLEVLRALSTRLIGNDPSGRQRRAEDAFVELGIRLSTMVGREGYRALVTRALDLATEEFPQLSDVRPGLSTPGRLVGLPHDSGLSAPPDQKCALVATLAALLWLLDQFVGEDLTHALVGEVWPWVADCGGRCQS
jgi:hypothetical protein